MTPMDKCWKRFGKAKIRNLGQGKYACTACHADVSLAVLEMYLQDPFGTVKRVQKSARQKAVNECRRQTIKKVVEIMEDGDL